MANVLFRKKWPATTQVPAGLLVAQSLDVASSDTFGTTPHPANKLFTIQKAKPTDASTSTGVFYAVAAEGYPACIMSEAQLEGAVGTVAALKLVPQGWTAPSGTVPGYLTFTCSNAGTATALPANTRVNVLAVFAMTATPTV